MDKHGFTMLELMAVVVIVGVLVTIALPTYRVYIAKSRQAEAKINLAQIGTLQDLWKLENGTFATLSPAVGTKGGQGGNCGAALSNVLGFRPKKCGEMRYDYTSDGSNAVAESGTTTDYLIFPGCDKSDKWTYGLSSGEFSQTGTDNVIDECK